jgi:hypothetical protein
MGKEKSHYYVHHCTERFEKLQYLFMIKTLRELGIREVLIKSICKTL